MSALIGEPGNDDQAKVLTLASRLYIVRAVYHNLFIMRWGMLYAHTRQ